MRGGVPEHQRSISAAAPPTHTLAPPPVCAVEFGATNISVNAAARAAVNASWADILPDSFILNEMHDYHVRGGRRGRRGRGGPRARDLLCSPCCRRLRQQRHARSLPPLCAQVRALPPGAVQLGYSKYETIDTYVAGPEWNILAFQVHAAGEGEAAALLCR